MTGPRKTVGNGQKQPAVKPRPNADLPRTILSLVDQIGDADAADSALDRAQEKMFDAFEARTARRRVALAKEALAISPLCADAYSILAEETKDPTETLRLYRQAVEAGAKALGEDAFQNDVGYFWGLIETRPYMRALHGLADALRRDGAHDEAMGRYRDLLRLNPNDNQGVRYTLLDTLLELGREREAGDLLKQYKNDSSAAWAWSRVLLQYRRKGDGALARKALEQAVAVNPHVSAYLLGRKAIPAILPDFIGCGDENEAIAYAHGASAAWDAADGARAWVRAALTAAPGPDAPAPTEEDRVDDAVLALLLLGLHDGYRAWKGFDWGALSRLHQKGLISEPAGRAKSVVFSEEGLEKARRLYDMLFVKGAAPE